MTLDLQEIRDELCHYLRNADILTTTIRGVTTATETFTATASQTVFTLAHVQIRNIRSLTVASVSKQYLRDYTVAWETGVVTLNTGASVGNTVAIQYDYGTKDKIYPDYPRDDLSLTSYPRVGIELTSIRTEPLGIGGTTHMSSIIFTIYCWVSANKDTAIAGGYGGLTNLNTLMKSIRSVIRTNATSFYASSFVTPLNSTSQMRVGNDKIIQESQDVEIKFKIES